MKLRDIPIWVRLLAAVVLYFACSWFVIEFVVDWDNHPPGTRPGGYNAGMTCTVYVYLPEEAVDVWRPVTADLISDGVYRLHGPVPDDEVWEFQPGAVVRCEERELAEGVETKLQTVAVSEIAP